MTKKISTPTNPPPNPKISNKVQENNGQDRERTQAVDVRTVALFG